MPQDLSHYFFLLFIIELFFFHIISLVQPRYQSSLSFIGCLFYDMLINILNEILESSLIFGGFEIEYIFSRMGASRDECDDGIVINIDVERCMSSEVAFEL